MAEDPIRKLSGKAEQQLGIIPGTKFWSPFPFSGMNQQDAPPALDDKEYQYVENFFRLGNGLLRTAYDVGPALYVSGANKIVSFFWYNIAATDYVVLFFADGTARQVRQYDGQVSQLLFRNGTSPLFYVPGNVPPACVQWGTLYLVISNNNDQNDYWLWDGSILYGAGTIGPVVTLNDSGRNYSSVPTITVYGGSGTGIDLVPTINDGGIVNLTVEQADPASGELSGQGQNYLIGDQLQVQFSGGGTDTSAQLIAVLADAGVAGVDITRSGKNYTTATVAFVRRPWDQATTPTDAAGTVTLQNGKVKAIVITPGHEGSYTAQPLVIISGNGTGAEGQSFLQSGIMNGNTPQQMMGSVVSVIVQDGGTNYITSPQLQVIGNGDGALLTAELSGTRLAFVNILSGGSGNFHAQAVSAFKSYSINPNPDAATLAFGFDAGILTSVTVHDPHTPPGTFTYPPTIFCEPWDNDWAGSGGSVPNGQVATLPNLQAVLEGTSIGNVVVTAPGQHYTQTPGIFIVPGANNAASATVNLMPFGTNGGAMESFQQQLYLFHPHQQFNIPTAGNFLVSAPESLTDFATSDGGLIFVNSDRFLRKQYVGARQSSGYLYIFGDDSIAVLSNVQTSGSPATTTFNYQNVDPQNGLAWRDTLQDFGRTILFANETGVYGLYGGAATKVSGKLDNLFNNAQFPPFPPTALTPSSAVATVFNRRHYFMLMTIRDPFTFQPHNCMVTWNEREWVLTSQNVDLTYIGTQEVNGNLMAWGTDGTALFPLFHSPSSKLSKKLVTKSYGGDQPILYKQLIGMYLQAQDQTVSGVAFDVQLAASGIVLPPPQQVVGGISNQQTVSGTDIYSNFPLNIPATFNTSGFPWWPLWGTAFIEANYGMLAQLTLTTTSPDFILSNLVIAYRDEQAFIG